MPRCGRRNVRKGMTNSKTRFDIDCSWFLRWISIPEIPGGAGTDDAASAIGRPHHSSRPELLRDNHVLVPASAGRRLVPFTAVPSKFSRGTTRPYHDERAGPGCGGAAPT